MSGHGVEFKAIRKSFSARRGTVAVLKDISLTIEPGEFFVLLGPSGCGKSTLLNLVAGLERPDNGVIRIGTTPVFDGSVGLCQSPFERDVAMVFQSYALYPHMTVAANIDFPLTNMRPRPDKIEREKRVRETAALLHITDLLDRKPAELSGGQRQRVAIGRAIVRKPRLFLMDEPLSNLDAQLRTTMRTQLKALQRELGITSIYVTHDQVEAMTLGDRIAVMHGGVIEQVGTPADVYDNPASPFVARFVGAPPMNLIPACVETTPSGPLAVGTGFAIAVEVPQAIRGHAEVFIGIRPEGVDVVPAGTGDWDVTVTVSENMGSEWYHYVMDGADQFVFKTGRALGSTAVSLRFQRDAMRLFAR